VERKCTEGRSSRKEVADLNCLMPSGARLAGGSVRIRPWQSGSEGDGWVGGAEEGADIVAVR